jgi:PAS domain-containing protein
MPLEKVMVMDGNGPRFVTDLGANQLAGIINFIPDAVLAIDLEGKVIIWNKAMEELTSFKAEEILGKDNYEYAIPFYGTRRPILVDLVTKPNRELEAEYSNLQRIGDTLIGDVFIASFGLKGSYIWAKAAPLYDSTGNVIGAIESIRDITERKQIDEALKESEERYRRLFEVESDALFLVDCGSGEVIDANPAALRMYGYTREELLSLSVYEISEAIADLEKYIPLRWRTAGKMAQSSP